MSKLMTNHEIISDKTRNPVTSTEYIKHGEKWLAAELTEISANKADKSYVDTELAKKANTTEVNASLAEKATKLELEEAVTDLKESISYVTPEMFGAVGDGIQNDKTAFENMFAYIKEHTSSIASEKGVYNISAPVAHLKSGTTYYISGTISIPCSFLKIVGNGAKIQSDNINRLFEFSESAAGWQTEIDDVSFVNCKEPIYFSYMNIESGRIVITKNRFNNCRGYAITTLRRSCIVKISGNTFEGTDRYWYSDSNDVSIFEDNWASSYVLDADNTAPIKIVKTSGDEYSCRLSRNLFVPCVSSVTGRAWINCGISDITIEDNRFGGESGSMPIINTLSTMSVDTVNKTSSVRIINNLTVNVYRYRLINLIGLPSLIEVTGNKGFYDNTKIIDWDDSVSSESRTSMISSSKYLKIIIFSNNGHHVDSNVYDEVNSNVPENLIPYVNKIFDKSSGTSQYEIEIVKDDDRKYASTINIHLLRGLNYEALSSAPIVLGIGYYPNIVGSSNYVANMLVSITVNRMYDMKYTADLTILAKPSSPEIPVSITITIDETTETEPIIKLKFDSANVLVKNVILK